MTAYTMTTAGNYSASATWGGVDPSTFVPGTDTLTVPATITGALVLDTSTTIPAMTIEDDVYGVVQATGVTTTLGGILTLGNGSAKDGKFSFGAGATLDYGAFGMVVNNCILASNATSTNWAKVIGTASTVLGAVYTSPKQNIQVHYVSWQNTGTVRFPAKGASGAVTSYVDVSHCAFVGNTAVNIGTGGSTLAVTPTIADYCDFRDCGDVTFAGLSDASSVISCKYSTFKRSTTGFNKVANNRASAALDLTGSVLVGYGSYVMAGPTKVKDVFLSWNDQTTDGDAGGVTPLSLSVAGSTMDGNYVYVPRRVINAHVSGGSGSPTWQNSVYEMYGADGSDGGQMIIPSEITVDHVLFFGAANAIGFAGEVTWNCTVTNCTMVNTQFDSYVQPTCFWLSENGGTSGTLILRNNIHGAYGGMSNYFLDDNGEGDDQVFAFAGYNNVYNTTLKYRNVVITDGSQYDLSVDPNFVDPTRSVLNWNGHTTDTETTEYLLKRNGFNSTTMTQSDTPTTLTVADLIAYVRAGFAPTNAALAGAGYGGVDIGAVDVYIPPVVSGGIIGPMHLGLGLSLN